jgi:YegS/Rv2252/BmrU family lipid kinase
VKTLFVINPRSGARRNYDISTIIRESATVEHELRPCPRKDDLDGMLDTAEREGFEVIYAVGGDGTVHELAKRLLGRSMALGIVPTGSGNGFARHIGLPMDPRASLRACAGQRIETIDTAAVNGIPFLGVMGIGFDALVADRFAASSVRGFRTYVSIGLKAFFSYQAAEHDVIIDGEELHLRAFTIAVANASQYGNNARIAPHASVKDGQLDVVLVEDLSLLRACALLPRLLRGTIDKARGVTTRRGRHIEIRRPSTGPAHLDGEPLTLPALLTIDVKPASLRVLVPDAVVSW